MLAGKSGAAAGAVPKRCRQGQRKQRLCQWGGGHVCLSSSCPWHGDNPWERGKLRKIVGPPGGQKGGKAAGRAVMPAGRGCSPLERDGVGRQGVRGAAVVLAAGVARLGLVAVLSLSRRWSRSDLAWL